MNSKRSVGERFGALAICVAVIVTGVAGCSGRRTKPGYVTVNGIVRYEGKPLQSGSVLFAPAVPGDTGMALIETNGSFSVMLAPGDYTVAVRCYKEDATASERDVYTPPTSLIPERYTDAKTSGLTVSATGGMAPVSLSLSR